MNYVRTAMLLAGLTALLMAIGFLIGGASGAIVALLVAAIMNLMSYWNADKLVLTLHGAREVDARAAPELVELVRDLSQRAGIPMPRVMKDIAAQRIRHRAQPQHAAVAVSTGLINRSTATKLRA
jgi:heat shock protein HtpX